MSPDTKDQLSSAQQPQWVYPAYFPSDDNDEIDLFELFAALWRRRLFIATTTTLFALAAIGYVLIIASPTYQVKARIRQPADSTLVQLHAEMPNRDAAGNMTSLPVVDISKEAALGRFQSELESRELLREVFDEAIAESGNVIPWTGEKILRDISMDQLFLENFLDRFKVTRASAPKGQDLAEQSLDLIFETQKPKVGANITQRIIALADKRATDVAKIEYVSSIKERIEQNQNELERLIRAVKEKDSLEILRIEERNEIRRAEIENKIAALKIDAKQRREDQLQKLREALTLAKELNIVDPVTFDDLGNQSKGNENGLKVLVNERYQPDYLRGSKVLAAEIDVLTTRESDDFVTPQIRDLERELAILKFDPTIAALKARQDYRPFAKGAEALQTNLEALEAMSERSLDNVSFIRIDLPPIPPAKPVAPKKMLIVAAATMAGGMFAMVIAIILNMRDNRRRERLSAADV